MIVDLISDLHLSVTTPAAVAAFKRYLSSTPALTIYLLGDWFDAWVGPEQALEEPAASLARDLGALRASGKLLRFMPGNRDFLLSSRTLSHWGVELLDDPYVLLFGEQRVTLTHGDALCLSDLPYQSFRLEARSAAWQTAFLSKPYPERQQVAAKLRADSENAKRTKSMSDMDIDRPEALRWLAASGSTVLIHGHTHRPTSDVLAPNIQRHVLSDWHLDGNDGMPLSPRAEVLRLSVQAAGECSVSRVSLA